MTNNLQFKSPAKINLGLSILSKLETDLHELETIYQVIPLFDDLEFSLTTGEIKLNSNLPELDNQHNLILKVATYLKTRYQVNHGISIKLTKNIPIGSGLGGGSSNAAATLKALNQLWNLALSHNELLTIARQFGNDAPFFIDGGCQYEIQAGSRALEFETLPSLSNCQLLIVIPNFEILSKEAFAKINYQQINQTSLVGLKQAIKNQDLNAIASNLHNDFEIWTLDQYPQLKEIKQKLSSMGAKASLMSGKGSTIFALFDKTQPIDQLTNYKTYQFIL